MVPTKRAWIPLLALSLFCAAMAGTTVAQESEGYSLLRVSINHGGRPILVEGFPGSASYRIAAEAIGDAAIGIGLSAPGYSLNVGILGSASDLGEVTDLRWTSATDLEWDADPAAHTYHVYRGELDELETFNYGTCLAPAVPSPSFSEPVDPAPGTGRFYLVTSVNAIAQEGSKGRDSASMLRYGSTCP